MTKPQIAIYDAITDKTEVREMTDEEYADYILVESNQPTPDGTFNE
jgi:hypothetical protein